MANIRVFNPWNMVPTVWEDAAGFMSTAFGGLPKANMYEKNDKVHVEIEVAGFKSSDIDISITGDLLTISGKREEKTEDSDKKYYFSETSEKSFTRTFSLPFEVIADESSATFKDGMLYLELPKSEKAKPKTVKIQADNA